MEKYLLIENDNVCPIEGFTLLGVSTSRGKVEKVGMFGSGGKHSILVCLRGGITPVIFLGKDEVKFFTKKGKMGDKEYEQVWYTYKGETHQTSMTLDFGAIDWNDLDMGLREFVSNAIDNASGKEYVKIRKGEFEPAGEELTTRVYIPLNDGVNKFFGQIPSRFLQFNEDYDANQVILDKEKDARGKVYRQGVFVREIGISLFNYNFGNTLSLDESRVLNDSTVKDAIAKYYRDADIKILEKIIGLLPQMHDAVEGKELNSYYLMPQTYAQREVFKKAFVNCWGDRAVIALGLSANELTIKASAKGYVVVPCTQTWYNTLLKCGIRTVAEVVGGEGTTKEGNKVREAGKVVKSKLSKIWTKLDNAGVTEGKSMPEVKLFEKLITDGTIQECYIDNEVVYINDECVENKRVIIDAFGQYITGGWNVKDWALRCVANVIK